MFLFEAHGTWQQSCSVREQSIGVGGTRGYKLLRGYNFFIFAKLSNIYRFVLSELGMVAKSFHERHSVVNNQVHLPWIQLKLDLRVDM